MFINDGFIIINGLFFKIKIKQSKLEALMKKLFKVNPNKIIFSNFHGAGYGCNPKYIAQEIIKQKLPYELVWVVNENSAVIKDAFPKEIRLVEQFSLRKMYDFVTAKYWVINTTLSELNVTKRDEQVYIQTGHGSFGIKKIGTDIGYVSKKKMAIIDKESVELNYFISHSKFETEVYSRGFKYSKDKILEFGHARNDIFFKDSTQVKDKVYSYCGLDCSVKTLLYVPTFRKDNRYDCYDIDYNSLVKVLQEKFGGEWKILVRFHPRTIPILSTFFDSANENIVDVTYYDDIQELLVSADAAITDYSSCIFDFMLTKRPAFIFATDIEQFNKDQGCYFPLSSTPFPIASSNSELLDNIISFDNNLYLKATDKFLEDKGSIEDGHAAEKLVEFFNKLNQKK